jgi:hypothetical protein
LISHKKFLRPTAKHAGKPRVGIEPVEMPFA